MKYQGSKARFTKRFAVHFGDLAERTYVEPFAGGMNMISEIKALHRVANERNHYIVEAWRALRAGWRPKPLYTREEYSDIRSRPWDYDDHVVGYVGVCCSYCGVFFGSYSGVTQTKKGTRDYQAEALRNVLKQLPKLEGVEMVAGDYTQLAILDDSAVYCDPPYKGTSGYKDPCSGKVETFDSFKFYDWASDLSTRCDVFVSEYIAPDWWELIDEIHTKSSLSANGVSGGSKASTEKLYRARPLPNDRLTLYYEKEGAKRTRTEMYEDWLC